MVEFITQNPATNALRTAQGVASSEEQRLTSEQNRLNEAVEKRRLQNVDDNIRAMLAPVPPITPMGPDGQPLPAKPPAQQAAGTGGGTVTGGPGGVPAPDPSKLPAASRGTPGQLVTDPRDLLNRARLGVPGMRQLGLEGLAANKERVAAIKIEQENKNLSNFIQIAKTNPGQAIAFAQLRKMNLPKNFIFALQSAAYTKRLNEELKRARDAFGMDTLLGQNPKNQAAFNAHMARVIEVLDAAMRSITQDPSPHPGGEPDPVTGGGQPVSRSPGAGVGIPRNQVPDFNTGLSRLPRINPILQSKPQQRYKFESGIKGGKLVIQRTDSISGEIKTFEDQGTITSKRSGTQKDSAKIQLIKLLSKDGKISTTQAFNMTQRAKDNPVLKKKLIKDLAVLIQNDIEREPPLNFAQAMAEARAMFEAGDEAVGAGQVLPFPLDAAGKVDASKLVLNQVYLNSKTGKKFKWDGKKMQPVK